VLHDDHGVFRSGVIVRAVSSVYASRYTEIIMIINYNAITEWGIIRDISMVPRPNLLRCIVHLCRYINKSSNTYIIIPIRIPTRYNILFHVLSLGRGFVYDSDGSNDIII